MKHQLAVLLALACAGCGIDAETPADSGRNRADAGAAVDAAVPPWEESDSGVASDAAVASDASGEGDAGDVSDAAVAIDASTVADAGPDASVEGGAVALVFSTEPPPTAVSGRALDPAPAVRVVDAKGAVVAGPPRMIFLTASTDATCQALAPGELTPAIASGAGTIALSGLAYEGTGTIYLRVTSPGLTPGCSRAIAVSGSAPPSPSAGPNLQVVSGSKLSHNLPSADYQLESVSQYGSARGVPAGLSVANGVLSWTPSADGSQSGIYALVLRNPAGQVVQPWIWVANIAQVCNPAWTPDTGDLDWHRVIPRAACNQLNTLYASGKAAGNVGDLYDNRDGLHVNLCESWSPNPSCPMGQRLFPQHDWLFSGGYTVHCTRPSAPQPRVTFGQESCLGSNAGGRLHGIAYTFYLGQAAADTAYDLYAGGNLYAFPSLSDDSFAGSKSDRTMMADPVTLERSTLNVANSPYVVGTKAISTLSDPNYSIHDASGSDLPFVKYFLAASAALSPEVKRSLITGVQVDGRRVSFVAPVLQLLLRNAHRKVLFDANQYLASALVHGSTYTAHYFASGLPQPAYDVAMLVARANALTVADVPPLVQLEEISETFASGEALFNTPGAIARSVAAGTPTRRIVVSAASSVDLSGNTAGFEYVWRVLDSDASKVAIGVNPANPAQATLDFTPGTATDRVSVGVFVRKPGGLYYSVPGIVSVHIHP